jgi:hypothetical protein
MVSPVPRGPSGPATNMLLVSVRVASMSLVVGAALADAAGRHSLAYWALVAAVPVVAVAALSVLGDVLDGTAAARRDRALAVLGGLALPFVLLAAAARAPLLDGAAPPAIGLTAVVAALAIFAAQALLTASTAVPRERLRAALRAK